MLFWLIRRIQKLFKALNSESATPEVALGVTFGICLGLLPFNILISGTLILLIILVRCNITGVLIGLLLASFLGLLLDPVASILGRAALLSPPLNEFWTTLYNLPLLPLSNFNHVSNCGYMILLPILVYPIYRLFTGLVTYYRTHLAEKVKKSKLYKLLNLTRIADISQKLR